MIRILIHGICGHMGRAILEAASAQSGLYSVVAGVDCARSNDLPVPVYPDCDSVQEQFDVLIDFSVAAALPQTLLFAEKRRVPIVVGTTGLTERHLRLLQGASEQIPVFQSGNMSVGVALLVQMHLSAYILKMARLLRLIVVVHLKAFWVLVNLEILMK